MQHGEAERGIEGCVGEGHGGGLLIKDGHVLPGHSPLQGSCKARVNFDASEGGYASAEQVSGYSGAGADFENVRSDMDALENPGQ